MKDNNVRLGYCCINLSLASRKITANRGMIKRTFQAKGQDYCSLLAHQNIKDVLTILRWNLTHEIYVYRISSDIFPWMSEYEIQKLPNFSEILKDLQKIGEFVTANGIRISMHPGQFDVLPSPNESVVQKTFADLELHGKIFDMMGLSKTHYNNINIHCNGVYGDKQSAMDRLIKNFKRLSPSVRKRLTLENDDKASMYSVKDLMYIHKHTGIPIVFDYHHHQFCTGGLSEEEALKLAATTWPKDIKQEVHYSESKALHENNPKEKPQAHSMYIKSIPNTYGLDVDIMVEAKGKELAILPFIK